MTGGFPNPSSLVTETATENSLNANMGKSTLTSTISPKFCREFADKVAWQKVDRWTGEEIKEKEE